MVICVQYLQTTGASEVTKVRIVGDSRENERRINEEVNRQGRRQKLLYEAESSARQNAAVAMKWSALFDKEIPQELFAEIELQRDSCERIIQSKDRLIKEFKAEVSHINVLSALMWYMFLLANQIFVTIASCPCPSA